MSPSMRDPGERIATSEYLKESGLLLSDISSLINHLETSSLRRDDQEIFELSDHTTPFEVPQSVNDAIGPVNGATIHYQRKPELSISVDLHGEHHTYSIARSPDTSSAVDTIMAIPPLDPFSQQFIKPVERNTHPHIQEYSDTFEQRLEEVPGISQSEFTELIMRLVYPAVASMSPEQLEKLHEIDIFEPHFFEQLVNMTHTSVFSHNGVISYPFLSAEGAQLEYIYEQGSPQAFNFTCIDDLTGEPIHIRAQFGDKIELKFPVHVVETGMHSEAIDGLRDFALDLREVKYVRSIIQDEIATFPEDEEHDILPHVDPQFIATSSNTLDVIENEIQASEDRRQKLEDLEIENDLYHLFDSNDNPADDSAPTQE